MPTDYLIIGGAGFIGRHLHRTLAEDASARIAAADIAAVANPDGQPGADIRRVDITRTSEVRDLFRTARPSKVIHLAGMMGVRECREDPIGCLLANVIGLENVVDACVECEVERLVFTSSSNVYVNTPPPFREDTPLPPAKDLYPITKQAGERLVSDAARESGLSAVVLRIFNVFGPGQRASRVMHRMLDGLVASRPIEVFGDSGFSRDYLYITDCVDGIIAAAEVACGFEVVNLGSGRATSIASLAALLAEAAGREARFVFRPPRANEIEHTCADAEKSSRLLSFTPRVTLEDGVSRFVHWHQSQEKEVPT